MTVRDVDPYMLDKVVGWRLLVGVELFHVRGLTSAVHSV